LLRSILDALDSDEILLGDAYYATYFLLCDLIQGGVDGLFEQHGGRKRSTDFSTGEKLGVRDHLIILTKPRQRPEWMSPYEYDHAPETLKIREFQAGGKILVTTFLCPKENPKHVLKALYRQRWNVGVSGEGHLIQSVKVRPRPKDSSLVAWEVPWRESKTVKPSDRVRTLAYRNVPGCNVQ
jgi:hypothetical protein